jgi:hypothetical protein
MSHADLDSLIYLIRGPLGRNNTPDLPDLLRVEVIENISGNTGRNLWSIQGLRQDPVPDGGLATRAMRRWNFVVEELPTALKAAITMLTVREQGLELPGVGLRVSEIMFYVVLEDEQMEEIYPYLKEHDIDLR